MDCVDLLSLQQLLSPVETQRTTANDPQLSFTPDSELYQNLDDPKNAQNAEVGQTRYPGSENAMSHENLANPLPSDIVKRISVCRGPRHAFVARPLDSKDH